MYSAKDRINPQSLHREVANGRLFACSEAESFEHLEPLIQCNLQRTALDDLQSVNKDQPARTQAFAPAINRVSVGRVGLGEAGIIAQQCTERGRVLIFLVGARKTMPLKICKEFFGDIIPFLQSPTIKSTPVHAPLDYAIIKIAELNL